MHGPRPPSTMVLQTSLRRLIRFLFVRPAFCLGLPSDSQSPAIPLPSANTSPCRGGALALLAVVLGSFPPGIVPLALARVHELVPEHHQQQIAWSRATVSFATLQAIAGFAYSALFNASGGHHALLFIFACAAIVLALFLEQGLRLLNRCDGLRPILN
jgi:hypothetical protein